MGRMELQMNMDVREIHNWTLNTPCDRCHKVQPVLRSYPQFPAIVHRGKTIERPWLCRKCYRAERTKAMGKKSERGG